MFPYRSIDDYVRLPTIEEAYRNNGNRHLERAIAYASAGYPDRFYEGSMRKALKNLKIANEWATPSFLTPFIDMLSKSIANNFIDGSTIGMGLAGLLDDPRNRRNDPQSD